MAKKKLTMIEEIAYFEGEIDKLKAEIAPILEAVKASTDIDRELCGNVGELFSLTSRLGGLLVSLELTRKTQKAIEAGLI